MDQTIKKLDFAFFGSGQHKIDAEKFLAMYDAILLDLRGKEEKETLDIKLVHHFSVIHIPLNELPDRNHELPKDKFIGLFCSSGVRSAIAFVYLKSRGYENVKIVDGGYAQLIESLMPRELFKHLNQ